MFFYMMDLKPRDIKTLSIFPVRKGQRQDTKFILLGASKPKSYVLFIDQTTLLPGILFCCMGLSSINVIANLQRNLILDSNLPKLGRGAISNNDSQKNLFYIVELKTGREETFDMKKTGK